MKWHQFLANLQWFKGFHRPEQSADFVIVDVNNNVFKIKDIRVETEQNHQQTVYVILEAQDA